VRTAHGSAAFPCRVRGADRAAGAASGPAAAVALAAGAAARPGDRLPQVPGEGARPPLRQCRGTGRRPGTVPAWGAGPSPAAESLGARLALVPAPAAGGGPGGGPGAG